VRTTLDPTLDVVFKSLFGDERNRPLLISLLNAILRPKVPIQSVTVLHPEPSRNAIDDKGIVLDLRLLLVNGEQVDIEMQSQARPALRPRALYYWARMYGDQLGRGDGYEDLRRCVVVMITNFKELEGDQFHSLFRVQEVHGQRELTDHLELHLVELPKLGEAIRKKEEPELVGWAKFLTATTDEELTALAMKDPVLQQAKDALDRLSADPAARVYAQQREMALISYRLDLGAAHRQGLEEGEARGRAAAILALLAARQVAVSEEQHTRIVGCRDLALLDRWLIRAVTANDASEL